MEELRIGPYTTHVCYEWASIQLYVALKKAVARKSWEQVKALKNPTVPFEDVIAASLEEHCQVEKVASCGGLFNVLAVLDSASPNAVHKVSCGA